MERVRTPITVGQDVHAHARRGLAEWQAVWMRWIGVREDNRRWLPWRARRARWPLGPICCGAAATAALQRYFIAVELADDSVARELRAVQVVQDARNTRCAVPGVG